MIPMVLFLLISQFRSSSSVVCAMGMQAGGKFVLVDLASGTVSKTIYDFGGYINGLTRNENDGTFYMSIGDTIFKYNPCLDLGDGGSAYSVYTGNNTKIYVGYTSTSRNDLRSIAYNNNLDVFYVLDFDSDEWTNQLLYSVDPSTLVATYIGTAPSSSLGTLEFDNFVDGNNGLLYSWSSSSGLISLDINDGSSTIISEQNSETSALLSSMQGAQSIAFDPSDNNYLYIGDQFNFYRVDKRFGNATITSLVDDLYRGLYLLDQDSCDEVICTTSTTTTTTAKPTNIPSNTPSNIPSRMPSINPINKPSEIPYKIPSGIPSDIPTNAPSPSNTVSSVFSTSMTSGDSVNSTNYRQTTLNANTVINIIEWSINVTQKYDKNLTIMNSGYLSTHNNGNSGGVDKKTGNNNPNENGFIVIGLVILFIFCLVVIVIVIIILYKKKCFNYNNNNDNNVNLQRKSKVILKQNSHISGDNGGDNKFNNKTAAKDLNIIALESDMDIDTDNENTENNHNNNNNNNNINSNTIGHVGGEVSMDIGSVSNLHLQYKIDYAVHGTRTREGELGSIGTSIMSQDMDGMMNNKNDDNNNNNIDGIEDDNSSSSESDGSKYFENDGAVEMTSNPLASAQSTPHVHMHSTNGVIIDTTSKKSKQSKKRKINNKLKTDSSYSSHNRDMRNQRLATVQTYTSKTTKKNDTQ